MRWCSDASGPILRVASAPLQATILGWYSYRPCLQERSAVKPPCGPRVTPPAHRSCAFVPEDNGTRYANSLSAASEYVAATHLLEKAALPNAALASYFSAYEVVVDPSSDAKKFGYDKSEPEQLSEQTVRNIQRLAYATRAL